MIFILLFLKILFIYILEIGEGRKKEKERSINVQETSIGFLSHSPNQGPGLKPRHVPQPESNRWAFSLQDNAQPTEPYLSGQVSDF